MYDLAENLKYYRKSLNMTQIDVASALGITVAAYSQYENNLREPKASTVLKMANIFNCSTDDLLRYKDPDEIPEDELWSYELQNYLTAFKILVSTDDTITIAGNYNATADYNIYNYCSHLPTRTFDKKLIKKMWDQKKSVVTDFFEKTLSELFVQTESDHYQRKP